MGYILGISAFYHDSAAALIRDGKILLAVQEERFTRKKGDSSFPKNAIQFCLKDAGVKASELSAIVYYEKPWLTFERILFDLMQSAPFGFENFQRGLTIWSGEKFFLKQKLQRELGALFGEDIRERLKFSEHHLSHAGSAFYPSPFNSAAILTVDGVGEWATCTIGRGNGTQVEILEEMRYPNSWGLVYAAFTHFLGFKVNSGEYKVMGLAPYADKDSDQVARFREITLKHLIKLHDNGSITLNSPMFDFRRRGRMVNPEKWSKLFGIAPRKPESLLTKEHANLAFALQSLLEEGVLRLARHAQKLTGEKNLVMAGGVALNCAANGRLWKENIFDDIWIQPAASDAGGALGAALAYSYLVERCPREILPEDAMNNCALGAEYSRAEIKAALDNAGLPYREFPEDELLNKTAELLQEGKIAGWFQGRAEWGPRALCRRSILARANDSEMQKRLNVAVKFRETFRPFAPVVLESEVETYFDQGRRSPYMLFTFPINQRWRKPLAKDFLSLEVGEKLNSVRSELPAVTHMDYSARIQTVESKSNPRMAILLEKFKAKSGFPVLVNTSFNRRGEPIVNSPEDAIDCFVHTGIDFLVIGDFLVIKS